MCAPINLGIAGKLPARAESELPMGRLSTPTWLQTIWDGSDRSVYFDSDRRCVAMPLGGLGTGHLCICGDGSLRQWQIANNINHIAYVPFGFFAIRAEESWSKSTARILHTDEFFDKSNFRPAPLVSDHIVPQEHIRQFQGYPLAHSTKFVGEYPIAKVDYELEDVPVSCQLTAWSPLVPFDSSASGMPIAVFDIEVVNRLDRAIQISLLSSLQNLVGWDGSSPIRGVSNQGYGGNVNRQIEIAGRPAIEMLNVALPTDHPNFGELVLCCDSNDVSCALQWSDLASLWQDFLADGNIETGSDGPSQKMTTWNGALCRKSKLEPKESLRTRFVYAWRFPNRFVDFNQKPEIAPRDRSRFYLGNEYAERCASAAEAAKSVLESNLLFEQTKQFHDAFYDTNLPYHMIDAVTANTSTLRTSICIRTADGNFFGFEGGCGASAGGVYASGGCCPMNCTHVWNYDQTLFHLFPNLHAKMRDIDWLNNQHETGYLPHRVILPLYLRRLWDMPIGGPTNPAADGLFAAILKTYQQWRITTAADPMWEKWKPHVKSAIEYAMQTYDDKGDGMIRGEQPNTYDIHLYGPNTFIGTMYLAALLACEKMLPELSHECRKRFESGSRLYDETCWNGEHYRQVVELNKYDYQYDDGCASDQLLGQWWAHVCGLGYVLPKDRVKAALESIFRRNFREDFAGFEQKPRQYAMEDERGLLNATYEKGQRPNVPLLYSDEVWSGVEYALASLMMYEGMADKAMQLVKAARDRYSGFVRNPFNEIECGDHYVRPMSAYSLLLAATGIQFDRRTGILLFAPNWPGDGLKTFFVAGKAYETLHLSTANERFEASIEVKYGEIDVSQLRFELKGWKWNRLRAEADDEPLEVEVTDRGCVISGISRPIRETIKVLSS